MFENRPDVLTWETEPLKEDTVIAGDIVAHLFASTSGTDSDWVVKLIDVYPESYPKDPKMGGYQLMVADEILRGRFRNSFTQPEPIPANQIVEYAIDLIQIITPFLKVTESWCRCKAHGFHSTIAIRRNSSQYFSGKGI